MFQFNLSLSLVKAKKNSGKKLQLISPKQFNRLNLPVIWPVLGGESDVNVKKTCIINGKLVYNRYVNFFKNKYPKYLFNQQS